MRYLMLSFLSLLLFTGCGRDENKDLKQWMQTVSKELKGNMSHLPEIKQLPAAAYNATDLPDPFQPAKIEPIRGKGMLPDLNRTKEPLEAYPLESLKMVGTIMQGKITNAMIQADTAIYQVKTGQYIGQNFGVITKLTESEVLIRELIMNAAGVYVARTSTLQLQETAH